MGRGWICDGLANIATASYSPGRRNAHLLPCFHAGWPYSDSESSNASSVSSISLRTYGEVGKDFIECHHTVPVSELTEGMKTKLSDMALVCSNCHRMLHRKRPWLRLSDLKALLRH